MYKTIMQPSYCECRVRSDNLIDMKIIGLNKNGKRVEVHMEKMPSHMAAHIADESVQSLTKARRRIKSEIDLVRQSCDTV